MILVFTLFTAVLQALCHTIFKFLIVPKVKFVFSVVPFFSNTQMQFEAVRTLTFISMDSDKKRNQLSPEYGLYEMAVTKSPNGAVNSHKFYRLSQHVTMHVSRSLIMPSH